MEAKELFNLSTYLRSHCHHETAKKPACISCSSKGFLILVTAKTDVVAKGTTALAAWRSRRAGQTETCSRDPLTHWTPEREDILRDHTGATAQNNTIQIIQKQWFYCLSSQPLGPKIII